MPSAAHGARRHHVGLVVVVDLQVGLLVELLDLGHRTVSDQGLCKK